MDERAKSVRDTKTPGAGLLLSVELSRMLFWYAVWMQLCPVGKMGKGCWEVGAVK